MTDNRKSGMALIAGSVGELLTMAIHPTSRGVVTVAQLEHMALVSGIAHSIAMISMVVLVLGACGLTRWLARPDRLALAGLVVYGFAGVAVLIATAVSGFIVPDIMRHMLRDSAAAASQWQIAIDSIFQINQAFSRIYTVGASGAMALWSAAALRDGGLARGWAIYGCVVAGLLVAAIGTGHLRLNVHGMTVVAVAQGVWFIGVGVELTKVRGTSSMEV